MIAIVLFIVKLFIILRNKSKTLTKLTKVRAAPDKYGFLSNMTVMIGVVFLVIEVPICVAITMKVYMSFIDMNYWQVEVDLLTVVVSILSPIAFLTKTVLISYKVSSTPRV